MILVFNSFGDMRYHITSLGPFLYIAVTLTGFKSGGTIPVRNDTLNIGLLVNDCDIRGAPITRIRVSKPRTTIVFTLNNDNNFLNTKSFKISPNRILSPILE